MNATVSVACRAVLIDIEGTTTPLAFVHDVLFPYADDHLDAYVAAHRDEPQVAQLLRAAAQAAGEAPEVDDATILAYLHRWIAEDRKFAPLKTLQGLIWADGYEQKQLFARVYPDAATALRRWHDGGFALYVYSSGSTQAQQLLFGHSDHGDLRSLFAGYFDTAIGPKKEAASYTAIAGAVGLEPSDVLFLSDVDAELDAARIAGMQILRLLRPADTPAGASTMHPHVATFDEISLSA